MNIFCLVIIYLLTNNTWADIENVDDGCSSGESDDEPMNTTTERPFTFPPLQPTTAKPIIPKGTYFDFIDGICNSLLNKFSTRRINMYLKFLHKSLDKLGDEGALFQREFKKFRKKLLKLSDYNLPIIKYAIKQFLAFLHSGKPALNDYFYAMNEIYTITESFKLDDYVWTLGQFGKGETNHIGEKTREVFEKIVFRRLNRQKEDNIYQIRQKFAVFDDRLSKSLDTNDFLVTTTARPEGIFERFLRRLFHLLSSESFPDKRLKKYVRLVSDELSTMEYDSTKHLAKHLKSIAKWNIKSEMIEYGKELHKQLPHRISFLQAMNEVFTLRENLLFSDYIYNLKDYSQYDKLYIKNETESLLNNVIVGSIKKFLSAKDQKELETKLEQAIHEYDEYDIDPTLFPPSLFNISFIGKIRIM